MYVKEMCCIYVVKTEYYNTVMFRYMIKTTR